MGVHYDAIWATALGSVVVTDAAPDTDGSKKKSLHVESKLDLLDCLYSGNHHPDSPGCG
jgi:hypothetical protein